MHKRYRCTSAVALRDGIYSARHHSTFTLPDRWSRPTSSPLWTTTISRASGSGPTCTVHICQQGSNLTQPYPYPYPYPYPLPLPLPLP